MSLPLNTDFYACCHIEWGVLWPLIHTCLWDFNHFRLSPISWLNFDVNMVLLAASNILIIIVISPQSVTIPLFDISHIYMSLLFSYHSPSLLAQPQFQRVLQAAVRHGFHRKAPPPQGSQVCPQSAHPQEGVGVWVCLHPQDLRLMEQMGYHGDCHRDFRKYTGEDERKWNLMSFYSISVY